MPLRNPYEVLGINEGSSSDDIKKRYSVLLRKYKAHMMEPEKTSLDFDIDEVNEAYSHLMKYDIKAVDPNENRKRPILRALKIDPSGFDNFWLYNRTKILAWAVSIALILSLVLSIINNKPKDFYIKTLGQFYVADDAVTAVQDRINKDMLQVDNSILDISFIGYNDNGNTTYSITLIQKFIAEVASKDIDIVLCDWDMYNTYMIQGVFMKLDDLFPRALLENNQKYYYEGLIAETEETKGYFGINVADLEFFKDIYSYEDPRELIFCIVVNTERIDAVKEFIDLYMTE
jgi:hypothetical protein